MLPCLFGCGNASDRQSHYVNCPFLFAIQTFATSQLRDFPPPSPNPLQRIGLFNPSIDCLKLVACTFSAYHSLKFNFATQIRSGKHITQHTLLQPLLIRWQSRVEKLAFGSAYMNIQFFVNSSRKRGASRLLSKMRGNGPRTALGELPDIARQLHVHST